MGKCRTYIVQATDTTCNNRKPVDNRTLYAVEMTTQYKWRSCLLWPFAVWRWDSGQKRSPFLLFIYFFHVFSGGRRIENHGREVTNEFVGVVVIANDEGKTSAKTRRSLVHTHTHIHTGWFDLPTMVYLHCPASSATMEENPHHDDDDDSLDGSGQRRVHAPRNGKTSSARSIVKKSLTLSIGGRSCNQF